MTLRSIRRSDGLDIISKENGYKEPATETNETGIMVGMIQVRRSMLVIGFLFAALTALMIWYYQKATSTENGALDLLDRFAESQARVQELEDQLAAMN